MAVSPDPARPSRKDTGRNEREDPQQCSTYSQCGQSFAKEPQAADTRFPVRLATHPFHAEAPKVEVTYSEAPAIGKFTATTALQASQANPRASPPFCLRHMFAWLHLRLERLPIRRSSCECLCLKLPWEAWASDHPAKSNAPLQTWCCTSGGSGRSAPRKMSFLSCLYTMVPRVINRDCFSFRRRSCACGLPHTAQKGRSASDARVIASRE